MHESLGRIGIGGTPGPCWQETVNIETMKSTEETRTSNFTTRGDAALTCFREQNQSSHTTDTWSLDGGGGGGVLHPVRANTARELRGSTSDSAIAAPSWPLLPPLNTYYAGSSNQRRPLPHSDKGGRCPSLLVTRAAGGIPRPGAGSAPLP